MENIISFLGGFTATLIALVLVCLLCEIVWAFCCSVSWHRWSIELQREYGRKPLWKRLPQSFFVTWWLMIGHRNNGKTIWSGHVGQWKGVGDWFVRPNPAGRGTPTR